MQSLPKQLEGFLASNNSIRRLRRGRTYLGLMGNHQEASSRSWCPPTPISFVTSKVLQTSEVLMFVQDPAEYLI